MDNLYDFLQLVRLGIGHNSGSLSADVNWDEIEALAERQGLSAIIVDSIERLPDGLRPPKEGLLQMIGQVVQGYEYRYELYSRAISELAAFYNSREIKMMVLKGYTLSLNWPKPKHRPCGDIDIWLFGKQSEADSIISQEFGIEVDSSEHHHTIFHWQDFIVENHYDFLDIHHHLSNAEMEKVLKKLAKDESFYTELYGEKFYIPSPNLHALFLLKHLMAHFAATEISLRQLLDWAFFVEKNGNRVDWDWLQSILDNYGMMELFHIFNAICIYDLGFSENLFPECEYDALLKRKVLYEILCPNKRSKMPSFVLSRINWKFRRWKSNEWKHKLCYKESMWSSFWSGVWDHLLKPSTI